MEATVDIFITSVISSVRVYLFIDRMTYINTFISVFKPDYTHIVLPCTHR